MFSSRTVRPPRLFPALLVAACVSALTLEARAQTDLPPAPPPTLPPEAEPPAPLPPPPPVVPPVPEAPPMAPPAPAEPAPAAPAEPAPPAAAPPASLPLAEQPLAGFSDGVAFLRAPDNSFIFFPNGRLQVDTYVFKSGITSVPKDTFLLRRARLELAGWIGSWVYFYLAGDFAQSPPASAAPAAPANIATTDDFVALAPWKNLAILQIGQFDAPFTLENRTSDKYFDFMERSITVRAFGIPDNKEMGAMLHGWNEPRNFLYSIAVVNGDGQNFKNVDNEFDVMGRAWVAPFSFAGPGPLHDVAIGGSLWTGDRSNTLAPMAQMTQGGLTFLPTAAFTSTPAGGTTAETVQLRQVGRMNAFAVELNVPVAHKYGVRGELVWKHQPLSEEVIGSSGASTMNLGGANLRGYSAYGEAWVWLLGDDTIIGDQQGLEPFLRYTTFKLRPPQDGVMIAARYEHLDENLTEDASSAALSLGNKAVGKTIVDSGELGVNYWHSKRFRATFNYVLNHFDRGADATPTLKGFASAWENELLFRFAVAL
ncbi:MAG TPA: porin [Polyangia bacterium]|nr:porin [Polyangia bacterium]